MIQYPVSCICLSSANVKRSFVAACAALVLLLSQGSDYYLLELKDAVQLCSISAQALLCLFARTVKMAKI